MLWPVGVMADAPVECRFEFLTMIQQILESKKQASRATCCGAGRHDLDYGVSMTTARRKPPGPRGVSPPMLPLRRKLR